MAKVTKRDITRVNFNLPTPVVEEVKKYANDLGLPVTQAYTVLISTALEQKDLVKLMPQLIKSIDNLKSLSEENQSNLSNDFDELDVL